MKVIIEKQGYIISEVTGKEVFKIKDMAFIFGDKGVDLIDESGGCGLSNIDTITDSILNYMIKKVHYDKIS